MATEDNLTRQIEEIEALSAIYPDELSILNEALRSYQITVRNQHGKSSVSITLQFQLPPDYPSDTPPQFELQAGWLRGDERHVLEDQLNEIYLVNMSDCIIHLWVEAVREFLEDYPNKILTIDYNRPKSESKENVPEINTEAELDDISELSLDDQCHHISEYDGVGPELFHGEFLWDRKSKFQAHLAAVHHKEEIEVVRRKLLEDRKVAAATHNIIAYRIQEEGSEVMYNGCEDDGEIHAGSRVLHLLEILEAVNVMVIITRWYGGIHLGPDRFKHINNLARNILHQNGYIREKHEKKGPRSKNSKSR